MTQRGLRLPGARFLIHLEDARTERRRVPEISHSRRLRPVYLWRVAVNNWRGPRNRPNLDRRAVETAAPAQLHRTATQEMTLAEQVEVEVRQERGLTGSQEQPATPPAGYWLTHAAPPLVVMAIIFWLGSDRGSADQTGGAIARLLHFLAPDLYARLSPASLETINVVFRKGGHFCGYGLLGLLNARALRARIPGSKAALTAWAAATLWAAVDEYHQSYSPTRGPSAADVLLDSIGAACWITMYARTKDERDRKGRVRDQRDTR